MSLGLTEIRKLKKFIKEIERHRGRHTELVSVYIPQGYDINKIINHLQQEKGTATNIKSAGTRKNVIDSLEKMIQYLKNFPKTPENGFAVFSGNVAEREGQSDVQVFAIEPPVPLNMRIYRCDKQFLTEPLEEMTFSDECYGLVVVDRRDGALALLRGKAIIPLKKTHSEVPGKMKAGGQSAQRFERLREGATKDHFKKVAEYMKEEFLNREGLKGIILGGPGSTVTSFLNKGYITGDVQKKIIAKKDLSYTGDFGFQELLEKSQDVLADEEIAKEKEVMQKFFYLLAKDPGKVTYGVSQVTELLKQGVVDTVILSEDVEDEEIEEFERLAEEQGSQVKIVSTEIREGVQLRELGKFAAILRFAME